MCVAREVESAPERDTTAGVSCFELELLAVRFHRHTFWSSHSDRKGVPNSLKLGLFQFWGPLHAKAEPVPFGVGCEGIVKHRVQRNRAPFSGFGLAATDGQVPLFEINLRPSEILIFASRIPVFRASMSAE